MSDDCAEVLVHLYEFLDGECCDHDADEIRAHLDACDHCVEDAETVLALKALIKRCCGASTPCAPPALRTRIMATYSVTQITYTVDDPGRRER